MSWFRTYLLCLSLSCILFFVSAKTGLLVFKLIPFCFIFLILISLICQILRFKHAFPKQSVVTYSEVVTKLVLSCSVVLIAISYTYFLISKIINY